MYNSSDVSLLDTQGKKVKRICVRTVRSPIGLPDSQESPKHDCQHLRDPCPNSREDAVSFSSY